MEGTVIGQYRIVHKIGSGGMGVVYVAEHTLIGRRAAIKVLLPEYSARRQIVTRFFNEARAMTSIPDPGIVQMYDFGFHSDGSAYIVMELLEGETLDRRLKRLRRLELVDAVRVTRQIAGSLATAHAAGIIHRDLKPENVIIVRDPEALGGERPKVLDFGVAKLSGDLDQHHTLAGTMMGTPAYMSPEQCRGAGEVDARSDIYSLGCVLACLVTGRLPFDRQGVGALISAHINDAPSRPSDASPDLPAELDDIVLRCLAKSPDDRYQTMLELQAACDELLGRLTSRGAPLVTAPLAVALPSGFRSALDAPVLAMSTSTPTTLSSAVGATSPSMPARPRRRMGVWIGFGGTVAIAGIAAAIAMSGSKQLPQPAKPAPTAPAPTAPAAAPAPAAVIPSAPAPAPAAVTPSSPAPLIVDAGVPAIVPDDAALAPSVDPVPAAAPAPPAKTRPKPKPRRPAQDLYDDR